jgi:exodeoxyribonuclease VII large subunit
VEKLRQSLNPDRPLSRGFARVHRADGSLARQGAALDRGEAVRLVFADATRNAVIDGQGVDPAHPDQAEAPVAPAPRPRPRKPAAPGAGPGAVQGDLF